VVFLHGGEYNAASVATTREYPFAAKSGEPAGNYPVRTGFSFTQADSGSNGYYVNWKAFPGETPVITSGQTIAGWELHDAQRRIYRAAVAPGMEFRQLYVNGVRAVRARTEAEPAGLGFIKETGFSSSEQWLAALKEQERIEMVLQAHWCNHRALVQNGRDVLAAQPAAWTHMVDTGLPSVTGPEMFKYLENAYEFLDQPGEFYWSQAESAVYYIPRADQDMASAEAVVPSVDELLTVAGGSLDETAHHLRFEGLTFEYSTWMRPSYAGYHVNQSN
jgi:hypothetical protein